MKTVVLRVLYGQAFRLAVGLPPDVCFSVRQRFGSFFEGVGVGRCYPFSLRAFSAFSATPRCIRSPPQSRPTFAMACAAGHPYPFSLRAFSAFSATLR